MAYPSDLKDQEWELIKSNFKNGNRAVHDKRILISAVLYLVKTGCQWRWLPKDYPNWKTVHTFYRRMCIKGVWEIILVRLVFLSRLQSGRNWLPTFGVMDSQSAKTTNAAINRGIDGGKKNKRQKKTYCH